MRKRISETGMESYINLPYENIPDDFEVKTCLTDTFIDLSYVGIFQHLHDKYKNLDLKEYDLGIEFQDKEWFAFEILEHQAHDYLESAIFLCCASLEQRDDNTVIPFVIPSAYCCRHALELIIKYYILKKSGDVKKLRHHKVMDLWNILDEKTLPKYEVLTNFIEEIEAIDCNGTALRYGLNTNFEAVTETFKFDIVIMISNLMYLFNVLKEHFEH